MESASDQLGHLSYLDFEVEVGIGSGREYPVAVLDSPAGEARATMWFPYDELALDNRLLTLQNALLRSGGEPRRTLSPQEQGVQDFGTELFKALFTSDVRSCYDFSLREAERQDKGLRLKLRILSPELAALPWEYLYHPGQADYVSLSTQTPVVRYLEVPRRIEPLTVTPPLRILGMVASPSDLNSLDVTREKQRIERAIEHLRTRGLVDLVWLPVQSWRSLHGAMRQGPWHIFHFVGHGGFDHQTGEGLIALVNREGSTVRFTATKLGRLLRDHRSLRLVLLNSCAGARGSGRDIFSSTAAILVRVGIPAVVAMQFEITDRAAIEFARTFYGALGDGMPVDGAVADARKAISFEVNNTVEWGTPVLYMHAPDGVLFEVAEVPRTERPPIEEAGPSPEAEKEQEQRLEQFYVDGLAAFRVEDWKEARRCFGAIVDEGPGYRDAYAWLQEAERQGELARLYAQAQAAREAGDWTAVLSALQELVARAPDYKNAAALLEMAKRQKRLADLHAQAPQPRRAGEWQALINTFAQMVAPRRLPRWAMAAVGGLAVIALIMAAVLVAGWLGGGEPTATSTPTTEPTAEAVARERMTASAAATQTAMAAATEIDVAVQQTAEAMRTRMASEATQTAMARPTDTPAPPADTPEPPSTDLPEPAPTERTSWQQGKIAFVGAQPDHNRLYVRDLVEGSSILLPEETGAKNNIGPWWSPDGTWLAFYARIDAGNQVMIISGSGDGMPWSAVDELQADFTSSPTWAPDGRRIVCYGARENTHFFILDAFSGHIETQLDPGTATARLPAWSPNDDFIAFASEEDGNWDIYTLSVTGGTPVNLTQNSAENYAPAWSPDGKWIAYQSDLDRGGSHNEIWIMDPTGRNQRRVTYSPSGTWSRAPTWSPDGLWIAFVSNQAGSIGADYGELFVVFVETGDVVQLTNTIGQVYDWRPSWGP